MGKKSDNFSHSPKHRLIQKKVLLQLPFWPKIGVFQLFLKPKTLMLNKKHSLKSGKKTKIRKGDWKEKARQETKRKRKYFRKKYKLQLKLFMLFFSWNKSKEERYMKKRQKQETKRKQKERHEGRKKDKRKRETAKEKQKKGEAKKG